MVQIDRRLFSHFDFLLLALSLLLPILGLIVLYSAGHDAGYAKTFTWPPITIHSQAFLRQAVFIFLGLGCLLAGVVISPSFISRMSYWIYAFCLLLLICVELYGMVAKGSQRWLSMGGFHIQPAEPMKLALVFVLAKCLSRNPPSRGGYRLREAALPLLLIIMPVALIVAQPDLGTSVAVLAIGLSMVLFMGIRLKTLLMLCLPVLIGVYPAWHLLHPYQKKRIQVLLNPEIEPLGSGYQIQQSKIAVGSGKLLGKGFMRGTQSQLEFLPEHTTDFVFSVLAEEWGFMGSILVLVLYLVLLYRMAVLVLRSKDLFAALTIVGVASLIFAHTIINVGMVVGLLPVVGLPLPLFSYGGSSVVSCMFAIGVVLGFDMRRLLFIGKG